MKMCAFTLLEAIIALSLTITLVLIPTLTWHHCEKKITTTLFKRELISNWESLRQTCYVNNCNGHLKTGAHYQSLDFIVIQNGHLVTKSIKVPAHLKMARCCDIFIRKRHAVTPTTLSFVDRQTNTIMHFKIQMGWGNILYEEV